MKLKEMAVYPMYGEVSDWVVHLVLLPATTWAISYHLINGAIFIILLAILYDFILSWMEYFAK